MQKVPFQISQFSFVRDAFRGHLLSVAWPRLGSLFGLRAKDWLANSIS